MGEPVRVVPKDLATTFAQQLGIPLSAMGRYGELFEQAPYAVQAQKVQYRSQTSSGQAVLLSGLLLVPLGTDGTVLSVPLLSYQHGTQIYRDFSPSRFPDHLDDSLNYAESFVGVGMAGHGVAVAIPDYPGLGDDPAMQPFVHGKSLAIGVVDMVRASRAYLEGTVTTSPARWNGQLLLMGYSEGGYATMAASREMQEDHAGEFVVTASAPMAGPYDLSGAMQRRVLSDEPFAEAYYLPLFLMGYRAAYANDPAIASALAPEKVFRDPFASTLPPMLTGSHHGEEINVAMGMTYEPLHRIVPKSVLLDAFLLVYADPNSLFGPMLVENNAYRGWTPRMPMKLFHHPQDDIVPFANSVVARDEFHKAGALQVEVAEVTSTLDFLTDANVTLHEKAALPAIYDAWAWLRATASSTP
ncbi:MAG: lipase family protein [Myxococcales bacterium]